LADVICHFSLIWTFGSLAAAKADVRITCDVISSFSQHLMKRTWTIVGVADVARSFKWYQLGGNPSTGAMEFALRDPDGYYVMVSDSAP